ncbi:hypothetical protein GUITHDRAFT_134601 [Guillardia theta CCMP2712]|uniref:Glycosyltransferase family 25 protein n=1 Tax=Guillardia theta (strain CCMP2712) TaxID=905079 RepID=L1JSL0_GUITC|nr:hypothetical protein GUITHDRAFT_134601 [Guillardia theta CCMP2712]EKX51073.1 hypothetical protein GUITHDRAFT_134601 [Guillardia theta CCMP2712]|eukprot:XP_005838053.1 hypothetical protein GUITHDRAFT_134601 [Guillardia theta CCMP2712]
MAWVGPYFPFYLTGGVRIATQTMTSLKAAKKRCQELQDCGGITGYWKAASMPELEWQWELRGRNSQRNEMWVQPSKRCCSRSFQGMLPLFYINLAYRSDRRENLLSYLAGKGVDVEEHVIRQNGVNRSLFSNATEIITKLEGLSVSEEDFWSHFKVQGKFPDIESNLYKGRIASWIVHRMVWKRILSIRHEHEWYIIVEDDVKMIDDVDALMEKLSLTTCLHPSVEIIYLTGRQVPNFFPGNVVSYLGVDAYVVSAKVIKKLLDNTVLGDPKINSLGIDTYLSTLVRRGVIDARMIEGGNAFVNSWREFASDIIVKDKP